MSFKNLITKRTMLLIKLKNVQFWHKNLPPLISLNFINFPIEYLIT